MNVLLWTGLVQPLTMDVLPPWPGQVLPREMLHEKVWGAGRDATYNNIEVYLTLVRRKLRAVGSKAELISERGIGYYLQEAE